MPSPDQQPQTPTQGADPNPSPESTGVYHCQSCGNTERFIGYDFDGYPGEDCECGAQEADEDSNGAECVCKATLRQLFTVTNENGRAVDIDYCAHTGGGYGAEIGSYQRIDCHDCGRTIWKEAHTVAVTPMASGAYALRVDADQLRLILAGLDALAHLHAWDLGALGYDGPSLDDTPEERAELAAAVRTALARRAQ